MFLFMRYLNGSLYSLTLQHVILRINVHVNKSKATPPTEDNTLIRLWEEIIFSHICGKPEEKITFPNQYISLSSWRKNDMHEEFYDML